MKPISLTELIRKLRAAGFEGPFPGGSHPFMRHGAHKVTIANKHRGDIDEDLQLAIIRHANLSKAEWERL
jgi:predicted RNA binding protein YcfA (HicA-like mRNA interferase family)